MNLIAVVLSGVIVVLVAIKIKDIDPAYGVVLAIAGCVMIMCYIIGRFEQITLYIQKLMSYVSLNITYIGIILKMIGIAYICQFSSDICKDAGYNAISSQIEMAGRLSLILLSMPVLMSVIELVVSIVES